MHESPADCVRRIKGAIPEQAESALGHLVGALRQLIDPYDQATQRTEAESKHIEPIVPQLQMLRQLALDADGVPHNRPWVTALLVCLAARTAASRRVVKLFTRSLHGDGEPGDRWAGALGRIEGLVLRELLDAAADKNTADKTMSKVVENWLDKPFKPSSVAPLSLSNCKAAVLLRAICSTNPYSDTQSKAGVRALCLRLDIEASVNVRNTTGQPRPHQMALGVLHTLHLDHIAPKEWLKNHPGVHTYANMCLTTAALNCALGNKVGMDKARYFKDADVLLDRRAQEVLDELIREDEKLQTAKADATKAKNDQEAAAKNAKKAAAAASAAHSEKPANAAAVYKKADALVALTADAKTKISSQLLALAAIDQDTLERVFEPALKGVWFYRNNDKIHLEECRTSNDWDVYDGDSADVDLCQKCFLVRGRSDEHKLLVKTLADKYAEP
jgi:hypothetical protein